MGMYAYFEGPAGEEVELKLTGLLHTTVNRLYPDAIERGGCELSYTMVRDVVFAMAKAFEGGVSLLDGQVLGGQRVYGFAADAEAMARLFNWMHRNSGNQLGSSLIFV